MTDDQLLEAFESCTLPLEQLTHLAHVRVGYLYVSQNNNLASAIDVIRARIKAYNKATNTPEAIDRGYHETITVAFVRLILDAVRRTGPFASSSDFCESHPELLDKRALLRFYSRPQIMTMIAKTEFVEPDLQPLPLVEDVE